MYGVFTYMNLLKFMVKVSKCCICGAFGLRILKRIPVKTFIFKCGTKSEEVIGPQKSTQKTVHLSRYDWKTREMLEHPGFFSPKIAPFDVFFRNNSGNPKPFIPQLPMNPIQWRKFKVAFLI